MGIPLHQPSKPPVQDQAQNNTAARQAGMENRHHSSGADGGHQSSSEQEGSESMIAEHGSSNGDSNLIESRSQDVAAAQDAPLRRDQQQDLQGIGAWAHD